jgi:hypothetical protein
MAKPEIVIVAEGNDKVLYINFFQNGEPIPNTLFRLQHPGMLEVEKWGNQVINHKGDSMTLDTTVRTKRFFKECVFPVSEAITPDEEILIEKYGLNQGGKPTPETIHPRFHSLWQRVSSRFLDGDLWNDIPESGNEPDSRAVTSGGKGKGK